ncbi:tryptophan--tRNA ligase [Deltaproteobacteria bacterium OttesenSCG-928-M10]|nr:tryptophan--tRNA ligase [Deltaproteobacteria bacterium OttesenSCG-928-M10]
MTEKKRVLSGIQPSGHLHVGNYFGMMKPMIEWQEKSDLFCFVVNLHALTTVFDPQALAQNTLDAVTDFLALGLDPDKSTFWVQGDVRQHTELTWILNNVTSMGLLERCHAYKEKLARGLTPNHGLFAYPVLMAADIILYQADLVPVGRDQKQHVEVARDIAGSFNHLYGQTFVLPEPAIDDNLATIPGTDGQKMSKSYHNTIDIFIEKAELKKRVMSIVTDTRGIDETKDPDNCNLFGLYRLFGSPDQTAEMRERYLKPGLKYVDAKKELIELIWNYFESHREKRAELIKDPDTIHDIMKAGAAKARAVAETTMEDVRRKIGLNY